MIKVLIALLTISFSSLGATIDPSKEHIVGGMKFAPTEKIAQGQSISLDKNVGENIKKAIAAGTSIRSYFDVIAKHRNDIDVAYGFCFSGNAEIAAYMINHLFSQQWSDHQGVVWDAKVIDSKTISVKTLDEPWNDSVIVQDEYYGSVYSSKLETCN